MAKSAQQQTPDININLMPGKEAPGTAGTAVHWALTVGRYLIIFTEIIAITIFVISIKLSTDKIGLKENIKVLGQQVNASSKFEAKFRLIQNRINEIKTQRENNFSNDNVLTEFLKLMPQGVGLESLTIDEQDVSFTGTFKSPQELQTLIISFSESEKIVGLDISELNTPSEKNPDYTFSATAIIDINAFADRELENATSQ